MPPVEGLAGRELPIRASRRQPVERALGVGVQRDAIRHELVAACVTAAAATVAIEELAGDVGIRDFAGLLVLKLLETAPSTAVAERFPLLGG
jgi:hypothetical protein